VKRQTWNLSFLRFAS